MCPTISIRELGKCYRVDHLQARRGYRTLRESLGRIATAPYRRLRGEGGNVSEEFWALRDVSFDIRPGEVVGVIGRNGAGKSTLLKILSRITNPTRGEVELNGRVGSLLEVGTGFHPELTGRENIFMNGAILGMSRREISRNFDAIVDFSEIERFLDTPVKRYSSGMYVRLAFAVAAHLQPEILIVDEVLAVGDAAFQQKCLGRMRDISQSGRTILFVSHNMAAVENLCGRAILLVNGEVAHDGPSSDTIRQYYRQLDASLSGDSLASRRRKPPLRPVITGVEFFDDEGRPVHSVAAGAPFTVRIRYAHDRALRDAYFGIYIETPEGTRIVWLQTRLQHGNLVTLRPEGTVSCRVPSFPLVPNTYFLSLGCGIGTEQLDFVERATHIEVVSSDFFGTGRLPSPKQATVLLHGQWDTDPEEGDGGRKRLPITHIHRNGTHA